MKKLNEKEQTQVAGGVTSAELIQEMEKHKGSPVGKYDGWTGSTYIFESPNEAVTGTLVESYEKDTGYGATTRYHKVKVIDFCIKNYGNYDTFAPGSTRDINGDYYQMYEYID